MNHWRRVDGILVESMGHLWAAFSPATGETALLNDESASILEVLEAGAADTATICARLAADSGLDAHDLAEIVEAAWPRLTEAGFVLAQPVARPTSQ
jgi:PqqD family protein of HPr-rel-A system